MLQGPTTPIRCGKLTRPVPIVMKMHLLICRLLQSHPSPHLAAGQEMVAVYMLHCLSQEMPPWWRHCLFARACGSTRAPGLQGSTLQIHNIMR